MLLLVIDNQYGLGSQPKNNFTGKVLLDGAFLENETQCVDIDRPYTYIIRSISKDNKQVAIILGWKSNI